ncbi:GAF domain-containing protein [Paenibacillus montanisoli]|uniref:GAF domain-containing protein n=1 Tax=Paenibacillus montanisoli TaxID=2081970 RepID=A0A328TVL0_9BACL|nr:GAF domain-containing protein [Paenibacillus montanisoli]RAP74380.1 GAF domain-containing protein [Paenibacillus montanisoli]
MAQNEEELQDMLSDGRYNRFLHRLTESWQSITIKWIVNFILAILDFINFPLMVILILFSFEQVVQIWKPKFDFVTISNVQFLIYVFGGWLLLRFLFEKTLRNITSTHVIPIWFANSKGVLRNHFYSIEKARQYSADLDLFVQNQADEYIRQKIRETEELTQRLNSIVTRLRELSEFPNETYESMNRTIEFLTDSVLKPNDPRSHIQIVLDRILKEISTTKPIQSYIKSATIMILDDDLQLRIGGQLNLSNSDLAKEIAYGERFAGKILKEGKSAWVPDVESREAQQEYDFKPDLKRKYTSVFGYPMQPQGDLHTDAFLGGVICLHFREVDIDETEITIIAKTLEVYLEFVISAVKLRGFHNILKREYGIIVDKEIAGGA